MKSLAISLALYLSTEPLGLNLVLNTHLQLMSFLPGRISLIVQVLFVTKSSNYLTIASIHSRLLGLETASLYVVRLIYKWAASAFPFLSFLLKFSKNACVFEGFDCRRGLLGAAVGSANCLLGALDL